MHALRRWWLRRRHGDGEWAALLQPAPADEWVSLDVETTGLDPRRDHILSLAAVPVRGDRVLLSERFERRIRPDRGFDIESIRHHRITPDEAAGGMSVTPAVREFLLWLGPRPAAGLSPGVRSGGAGPARDGPHRLRPGQSPGRTCRCVRFARAARGPTPRRTSISVISPTRWVSGCWRGTAPWAMLRRWPCAGWHAGRNAKRASGPSMNAVSQRVRNSGRNRRFRPCAGATAAPCTTMAEQH